MPIPRKGTKFIARARSSLNESIPIIIAVRDILHLARTTKEVKFLIHEKKLKLNGNPVKDSHESIKLLNTFETDKPYVLTFLPTGKFTLEEIKDASTRLCKVIGKKVQKKKKIQLNLHDGSNVIIKEDEKININDTIALNKEGKIKKHIPLEEGKHVLIISGKHTGNKGKIKSKEGNKIIILFTTKEGSAVIDASRVIVQ